MTYKPDFLSLRAGDNIQERWTVATKLALLDEVNKLRETLHKACERLDDGSAWADDSEEFLEMCKLSGHSHPCLPEFTRRKESDDIYPEKEAEANAKPMEPEHALEMLATNNEWWHVSIFWLCKRMEDDDSTCKCNACYFCAYTVLQGVIEQWNNIFRGPDL